MRNDTESIFESGRETEQEISRLSFSKSDLEARKWLKELFREAGL